MSQRKIIVGVDNSAGSNHAVRWAANEAARTGDELLIVSAYDWHVAGARFQIAGAYADDLRQIAETAVTAAIKDAQTAAPGITATGETSVGSPGHILTDLTAPTSLVVVGSRGRGAFASLTLGSVSQTVATHAHGPVVIVRGRDDTTTGPVVVGVGAAHHDNALRTAFEQARSRHTDLIAVHVYSLAVPPPEAPRVPYLEDEAERRANERVILTEAVQPWQDRYPDVSVDLVVVPGHPTETLVGASRTAQLVVVGHRSGRLADRLLGPVAAQLLHHAESPVLIARGQPTD